MLASPLYPTSPFSQQPPEDSTQYRPVRDLEAFNSLLPPPIEFVEGSSSGTLAIAEGKYEAINATPKATTKNLPRENGKASTSTMVKSQKSPVTPSSGQKKQPQLYNGVLDLSWPSGCSVGSGLHNTGNTCFLNSALQCLLHTPPLLHIISAHSKADPCRVKTGFCMSCNLRQVAVEAHATKRAFVPYPITTKLQTIAKHMKRGRQEDSHEFLRYAIDALQKSCLAGYPPKLDPKVAETTWVHRIFGGHLRSRVTCRECQHNSDTFDSILDLSLDIYGVASIKEALRKFVAVDYLKGSDKYKCEKCKKAVIAEKRFTVHDAPVVLTVHLKRFSPLGRKIGHYVKYDDRLGLQPIMSEGQFGPSYSLYGVICHAGGGPNSGHYYAHVKGGNGQWYEMNDGMVSSQRNSPVGMKNAYMLFYIRDKGQSLEAAITRPLPTPKVGIVANMRKRKVIDSDEEADDEDVGVKASRPFIGPLLPSLMSDGEEKKLPKPVARDPQAELVQKKIEATSQKANTALSSLTQYDEDKSETSKEESAEVTSTSKTDGFATESPPTSSPPPSSIPTSSFYSSSTINEKKRKSPDGNDDNNASLSSPVRKSIHTPSPKRASLGHRNASRKSSFGGGALNPYNRLKNSNNLHWSEPRHSHGHKPIQYGKRRKMII